jgi:hypothetical protein
MSTSTAEFIPYPDKDANDGDLAEALRAFLDSDS